MGKDDETHRSSPARWLVKRARAALKERSDDETRDANLRLVAHADRVLGQLEGAARTLRKVADLELELARRLVPIVDDLGELVRHRLDEARERRGLPGRGRPPLVIDQDDR